MLRKELEERFGERRCSVVVRLDDGGDLGCSARGIVAILLGGLVRVGFMLVGAVLC